MNKFSVTHRDPTTGRFTKFSKDKKLTREVYTGSRKDRNRVAGETRKFKTLPEVKPKIKVILTGLDGKRKPFKEGQRYRHGEFKVNGVKIFDMPLLGKVDKNMIRRFKNLKKQQVDTNISLIESLKELTGSPEILDDDEEDS